MKVQSQQAHEKFETARNLQIQEEIRVAEQILKIKQEIQETKSQKAAETKKIEK